MHKIRIATAGAVVVAVVLAAGTATYAAGQHSTHPGPAGPLIKHPQVKQQVTAGQQKLKNAVVVSGFSGVTLTASGFTPIDAGETLICPGTSGTCTFSATMSVQAQGTGSSNAWAICLKVDGGFATCPYLGFLDSTFFDNETQTESITGVTHGPHTVQTQVFTGNGGTAYNYTFTYQAYKP